MKERAAATPAHELADADRADASDPSAHCECEHQPVAADVPAADVPQQAAPATGEDANVEGQAGDAVIASELPASQSIAMSPPGFATGPAAQPPANAAPSSATRDAPPASLRPPMTIDTGVASTSGVSGVSSSPARAAPAASAAEAPPVEATPPQANARRSILSEPAPASSPPAPVPIAPTTATPSAGSERAIEQAPPPPPPSTTSASASALPIEAAPEAEAAPHRQQPASSARQMARAPDAPTPALARAAMVDQAIRLENATGQAAILDHQSASAAPSFASSSAQQQGHGGLSQGQFQGGLLADRAVFDDAALTPQIVRGLTAMVNQRGGAMTMRLNPPELGELRVQMVIARGTVQADFHAATAAARALLEGNMTLLRQSLEGHGLHVERLTVHAAPANGQAHGPMSSRDDAQANQQHQQQQSSASNQHDAGGSESRGRREQEAPVNRAWTEESLSFESLLGRDAERDTNAGATAEPAAPRA